MRIILPAHLRLQNWSTIGAPKLMAREYGIALQIQTFLNPHTKRASDYSFFTCKNGHPICALTRESQILLTMQYKQGVQGIVIEVPGGVQDANESPEEVAARELLEETGFRARKIINLGWAALHTRKSAAGLNLMVALDCEQVAPLKRDPNEVIAVLEASPQEVWEMIRNGEIVDTSSREVMLAAALHGYLPVWSGARLPE